MHILKSYFFYTNLKLEDFVPQNAYIQSAITDRKLLIISVSLLYFVAEYLIHW